MNAFVLEEDQISDECLNFQLIVPKNHPSEAISKEIKCLIELIADLNILYTQLEAPSWEKFIHSYNPNS